MQRLLPILLLVFSVGVGAEIKIINCLVDGKKIITSESGCTKMGGYPTTISSSGLSSSRGGYAGEYKDGKYHGQGTMTLRDGSKYVGEFKDGNLHGQGRIKYSNGDSYVGAWKNNRHHGHGTYTRHDGWKYVGEVKNGTPNGRGTATFPDGRKYVGEWRDNYQHGRGTYTFPNGSKYVGEWRYDKYHGQGTYTYANKKSLRGTYVGEWKDDREWNGVFYLTSGKVGGTWTDGMWCKGCRPESTAKKQTPTPKYNSPKRAGTGTGFFVSRSGYIVTNDHVVKGCNQINVVHHWQRASAPLVHADRRNDLALLKTSIRPSAIAYFRSGRDIRAGEDILAFGYPFKSLLSDELKVTKGMVNALSGMNNDTRYMQISAPVQPGNSGGPLLDHSGNVVGVVTARIDAAKMLKERGKIPQNVNFAIKASLVRDILEVKSVDYETASSKKELKAVDILDKAKKFTVLVECLQ